jgi:hypothetical protein
LRGVRAAAMLRDMQTAVDTRGDRGCPATTTSEQDDRPIRQPEGARNGLEELIPAGENDGLQALAALERGVTDGLASLTGGAGDVGIPPFVVGSFDQPPNAGGGSDVRISQGPHGLPPQLAKGAGDGIPPRLAVDERGQTWATATTSHHEIPITRRGNGHGRTQRLKSESTQPAERSRTWLTATARHHDTPTPLRGDRHEARLSQGLVRASTALDHFVNSSWRREAP